MAAQPSPVSATFSNQRNSTAYSATNRSNPPTALLIEYFEQHANKDSNMPSVRVKVNPYMGENQHQQGQRMSYISPLPTRENTVIDRDRQRAAPEDPGVFEQHHPDQPAGSNNPDSNRGRQRTRVVSEQVAQPIEEEEEPLPALPYRSPDRRDLSDPILPSSVASNDIVSSRQFQAIIASAIQELILPEIQAVRNELTAQAQLFHHQPGLQQASNQATFGTSTSGRKRSRSLTALDEPLHRRNSQSFGTMDEVHTLPPRPTSPNVPAAMEAESLLRADLRSELKITPPGTAHRETRSRAANRLSGMTDGPQVMDPSSHNVFSLPEGAYKKRESHEERMAAAKARRAAEKRARGEPVDEEIPENVANTEEVEATPERTRFSVLTADRPTESVIDEYETVGRGLRGGDAASLQEQLNEIFHHLKASATERSERESDILAQVSVLAEDTRRTMQQLKDTILEETNVTVGALSYNIERYVGRIQYGPRPFTGKSKGLGKSATYPPDRATQDQIGPAPGPAKRTTTFLQTVGNALTPAPGKAAREKRENMERLESMVLRVLEEVEMLKRMKQGARRKTNGEMFKGEARTRLNPPEDALTYMDELRGDAANRERGESEQERMARIESSARDFEEEEKAKRTQMQDAIATETNIIRQSSRDVRVSQEPIPEGSQPYRYPQYDESERRPKPAIVMAGQPLPGMRMDQVGNTAFRPAGVVVADLPPKHPQRGPLPTEYHEGDDITSPSGESYRHGDEQHFNAHDRRPQRSESSDVPSVERARMNARLSQVEDNTRKISIKDPIGLPSTAGAAPTARSDRELRSPSTRESGVLGEHLEGEMGNQAQTQTWVDRQSTAPPTPVSKDSQYRATTKHEATLPPLDQERESYEDPGPSAPRVLRQRSQYYQMDEKGRRHYYFAQPTETQDKGLKFGLRPPPEKDEDVVEWGRAFKALRDSVTPKKKKDKGKEKETMDTLQVGTEQLVSSNDPSRHSTPLPSLFAVTTQMESSPSNKLTKKKFRKPITAQLGIHESPVSTPHWQGQDAGDEPRDSEEKKGRRSWREAIGFSSSKPKSPKVPATLPRTSWVSDSVNVTYPGPSQEVRGRNGFNHFNAPTPSDTAHGGTTETSPQQPLVQVQQIPPRNSISSSVREDAMYNMQLSDELDHGRHPASMVVPNDVQWTLHRQAQAQQAERAASQNYSVENHVEDDEDEDEPIPGPFARRRETRDFTPIPQSRDAMPPSHLIPDNLLPTDTPYGPTEPLSPQKLQSSALPAPAPTPSPPILDEGPIYHADYVRDQFKSSLQRRPTPTNGKMPVLRQPRQPSGLSEQNRTRRPSTLQHEREILASEPQPHPGTQSPIKSESSYKTANDHTDYRVSEEDVRPPSLYSHDSIGGGRFSRNRARTPPDTRSSADYSNSTRPLASDPPAPARYTYTGGTPPRSSPVSSPHGAHLAKPGRVPSGPRVAPPNFSTMKTMSREERYTPYSRPSFASENTRPTSAETDDVTAVMGHVVKTDLRARNGSISANWVRSRKAGEVRA